MPNPLARPDPLDRRYRRRVATRVRGSVHVGGRDIACIVRDRSRGGRRIVFEQDVDLEPTFLFAESGTHTPKQVRLIWTDGRQAGISIVA